MTDPSPYTGFDRIGVGTEVHLRVDSADPDGTQPPHFADAKLVGEPWGTPGQMTAKFYVPSLGYEVEVSERAYKAWTRH